MDEQFNKLANDLAGQIINQITGQIQEVVNQKVVELISQRVNSSDVVAAIKDNIVDIFNSANASFPFKENTVPGLAVDTSTLSITGSNIVGGTIKDFASTGIDDKASVCQLTVLDAGTIFENTLYAPRIEIKGDAIVDGDLLIKGQIPKDSQTYQNIIKDVSVIAQDTYDRVLTRLQSESLDITQLTIGQKTILDGNSLTSAVINSQLQTVGQLRDLQTQGETLLSETLYTTNRRVGINTMDPRTALSIWDEEVEIGIGKQKKDTAQLSTRASNLVISSNNQDNITVSSDGTTTIPQLRIGNILFTSSPTPPSYDAPKGSVVLNENPNLGGPMGWISLGDARWANFGIID